MPDRALPPADDAPRRDVVAIAYDFDGTLSPQPMQEYTVLPKLGEAPGDFWEEVNRKAHLEGAEKMLVYMRLLLEKAKAKGVRLTRGDFLALGRGIQYFPGVEDWFERINRFVEEQSNGGIKVHHYVISAGLLELLEKISIAPAFRRIYASEYHYNEYGEPTFPKVLITDTTKTQYLFRINKGREEHTESINEHMPEELRPIPFSNIIYVGDGSTDVPSMTVTRSNGGHALAVYREDDAGHTLENCRELLAAERVDLIAAADFRAGRSLERHLLQLLRAVCHDMLWQELRRAGREQHPARRSVV